MDISKLHGEQNIMILHYLQLEGFMNLSVQENGIMFSFGADDKNIYLIKSDEKVLLEPSIYYEDGEFFLKDSSIFLLTQLAIWVSKKSPYTYSCKQYQYIKVRELFPVWFDGDFYLYTIRFNLENNSFVLRKGDSLLTFVASEPNTLDILLQAANIKKETPKQKSPQHNVFEFDLSGTKVNVELAYSPNSPQTEIDKWLSILKSEELDKMKIRLSKKLTKDVFSQTDNVSKNDLMEQTNLLYGKSIEKIIVDKGYITIIFLAPNVLPDYVINCQLNKRLSIIDYYLE